MKRMNRNVSANSAIFEIEEWRMVADHYLQLSGRAGCHDAFAYENLAEIMAHCDNSSAGRMDGAIHARSQAAELLYGINEGLEFHKEIIIASQAVYPVQSTSQDYS